MSEPTDSSMNMQGQVQQSSGLSADDVVRIIQEQTPGVMQHHLQQAHNQRAAESFAGKLQAAEDKYPGLIERVKDINFDHAAPVLERIADLDNSADVMNELLDNPSKLANLTVLAHTQPKLMQKQISQLSSSIKQNQEAQAVATKQQSKEPFSQIKPSSRQIAESGSMSVSDFRNMFKRKS